jgi:hypothetical protein
VLGDLGDDEAGQIQPTRAADAGVGLSAHGRHRDRCEPDYRAQLRSFSGPALRKVSLRV